MTDSQANSQPQPTPIPTPAWFPVTWHDPDEAMLSWSRDRMHFPATVTPSMDLFFEAHNHAFVHAFDMFEVPMQGMVMRRINAHAYSAVIPRRLPPDELEAMGERAQEKLKAAMMRMPERWDGEHLPEVLEHLRFMDAFDLDAASPQELVRHAEEVRRRFLRLWEIHFEVMVPAQLAQSMFQDTFADLFGADRGLDAHALLQGFDNKTVEIRTALWRLGRRAGDEVRRTILNEDPATVASALARTEAGRRFLEAFDDYLRTYGKRSETWAFDLPSWIEDPTAVWRSLRDLLSEPEADPEAERARLAAIREDAIAAARAHIAAYPRPVVEQFEALLRVAQKANVVSEDHGFYIDFEGAHQARRLLLAFGRRFVAAGLLGAPDDVMLLTFDEVLETGRALAQAPDDAPDRRALVAERRAEIERFRAREVPAMLGSRMPGPPPDNAITRAVARFGGTPVQQDEDPNVVRGHAGSAGVARGTARVVRNLSEAQGIRRGEVLVAPMTAPSWTSLFGTVAAVVTDTGGVLSHSAVVAREYGIPAVVGTRNATTAIRDGQLVEVDGRAGVVRILEAGGADA